MIYPMLAIVGEVRKMPALVRGQAVEVRALELHREHVLLVDVALIGSEIDRIVIHSLDAQNFVFALFQLTLELRIRGERVLLVEAVEVQVGVAVAPTPPNESVPRLQHLTLVIHLPPALWTRLAQ